MNIIIVCVYVCICTANCLFPGQLVIVNGKILWLFINLKLKKNKIKKQYAGKIQMDANKPLNNV